MTRRATLFLVAVFSVSCGGGQDDAGLGGETAEVVNDTDAMQEATAAANEILRNAADCTLVADSIGDVNATLDAIEAKIQTAAGRTSLQSLRKQVKNVADACGVR